MGNITDVSIERQIGSGNFGEVYLALAFNKTTKVALKRLKSADAKAFLNEIEVLSQLSHPNVVRFYGIYRDEHKKKFMGMIETSVN
jgi:serine/threonine protein kinase